jgi:AcrR family transcriptional regulator
MQYLSQRLASESTQTRDVERPYGTLGAAQRERILAATEALIAEKGCAKTSIEAIVKQAGVSSVTFYEHFAGKEECFVAAFDRALGAMRAGLVAAVPAELPRSERVWAGLAALLASIDADPPRARFCFVEAQGGGPQLRARYDRGLDEAAAALDDPLGQAMAGGLAWLVRERLELGGGGSVQDLLPKMTDVILAPQPANG